MDDERRIFISSWKLYKNGLKTFFYREKTRYEKDEHRNLFANKKKISFVHPVMSYSLIKGPGKLIAWRVKIPFLNQEKTFEKFFESIMWADLMLSEGNLFNCNNPFICEWYDSAEDIIKTYIQENLNEEKRLP